MNEELMPLLIGIPIAPVVGLVVGYRLRLRFPESSKSYTKFCLQRKWWLFGLGLLLFAALAVHCLMISRPYSGAVYIAFAMFEAWGLFAFGFKSISPQQAKQIEESDPTRVWPFSKGGKAR